MKEKIFTSLKQEYAHLGLGDSILLGLAEMLSGTSLVTDENIKSIVAGQKAYLESLQKSNDKRVQDAVAKTHKEASDKAEQAKREHEEALLAKQKEIDRLNASQHSHVDDNMSDWYKAEKAEREKRDRELADKFAELEKQKEEFLAKIKAMEDANAKAELERAASIRKESINAKAKEKGIPDWMIKHGFADIPADADEATIDSILSGYASEIQTQFLPTRGAAIHLDGKEATKADTDAIVDKLFPKKDKE